MKILLTFKNKRRILSEKGAVVSPHPLTELEQTTELPLITDLEIKQLEQNPYDDILISSIRKRKNVVP